MDQKGSTIPDSSSGLRKGEAHSGSERNLILDAIGQIEHADAQHISTHAGGFFSAPVSLPEDGFFPGYTTKREIHRGGQGVVYHAVSDATGREVAIKHLYGGATAGTSAIRRFEREIEVLGRLSHPGIVGIHGSGHAADGGFFYVMDFVRGRSLDTVVRELRRASARNERNRKSRGSSQSLNGEATLRELLELFAKLCEAVHAAHVAGVIHRDLKPSNVRLTTRDEPVVVDFGLAKLVQGDSGYWSESADATMTEDGKFVGSLPWASPEQAQGQRDAVDIRTDVYALGIILYQLVTAGRFPYQVSGSVRAVLDNIVTVEPRRPSSTGVRVNDEVETIALKALNKDRDRRYQSAGELGRDVRRYLEGEAIEAKRDSALYVLTKTVRKHKTPFAAAVGLLMGGVVFAASMTAMYQRAEAARVTASNERDLAFENFEDAWGLASAMVFEVHDAIANLRGATDTRRMLLDRALDSLDRLYQRAATDQGRIGTRRGLVLEELATGYDRLAVLLTDAGPDSTIDAATSFERAAELRARLRALDNIARVLDAEGPKRLATAEAEHLIAYAEFQSKKREYDEALASLDRAVFAIDEAAALDADESAIAALRADVEITRGIMLVNQAMTANEPAAVSTLTGSALERYNAAEQLTAEAEPFSLARIDQQRSSALAERGRWITRDATRGEYPTDAERIALLADALDALAQAETHAVTAVERLTPLTQANPDDDEVARSLFLALHDLGNVHARRSDAFNALASLGDASAATAERTAEEAALSLFRRALQIAELRAEDPSNLSAQRDLGVILNKIGNQRNALANADNDDAGLAEVEALYETLVESRRSIQAADPSPRHERDLGLAWFKLGGIRETRATLSQEQQRTDEVRPLLLASKEALAQALAIFQDQQTRGVGGERDVWAANGRLDRVRGKLENLAKD